jgi:hypothetical protein
VEDASKLHTFVEGISMRRNWFCLFAALVLQNNAASVNSAEPIATPANAATATRNVAAIDARTLALHQYFYVDFPRQLQALEDETELAEAELALIARRVNGYRPFRSFGRYAATYTADQSWQLAWRAAQQRLDCLRNDQADLWRQRTLAAAAFSAQASR